MKIAILILAAGSSTRMQQPKQLLPVGNKTLVEIAVDSAIKSDASLVCCVLGANKTQTEEALSEYDIDIVYNVNHHLGLSSSISEGVKYIIEKSFDAVLVMLGDQPKVDDIYLNSLIKTIQESPNSIVTSKYNNFYGVPAIFPKAYFNTLLNLKGDKGAKEFLNSGLENIHTIEANNKLIDIDTKEDYNNYLKTSNLEL